MRALLLHDIDDLCVGVDILPRGLKHGRSREIRDAQVAVLPVKPFDDGDRRVIERDAPGVGGRNAGLARELERQHFGPGDIDSVIDAWKLADGELAVFIEYGAFGPHPAERGAFALQVAEVLNGFPGRLDRARSLVHTFKFDDGWRRAPAFINRSQIDPFVARAKRADAA